MMEQSHVGKAHYYSVLITGCDDIVISDRASRLGYITDTAVMSSFNIISEREEGIGTQGYIV